MSNDNIEGITIKGKPHKIGQFADDTTLLLLYSKANLTNTFNLFNNFEQISGIKVNYDKIEIFPVGTLRECNVRLYQKMNVKLSHQ